MGAPIPESVLAGALAEQLGSLASELSAEQALWISGYFAGVSAERRNPAAASPGALAPQRIADAPAAVAARTVTILYGSETSNSKAISRSLAESARAAGLDARVVDMADYPTRALKDETDLLLVTSTHGEGDPPQPAMGFFEFLEGRKAPRLAQLRYAVLALGDSTYERYCEAGRRLDRRLEELGAKRIAPRVDCDVDYDEAAAAWIRTTLQEISAPAPGAAVVTPAPAAVAAPSGRRETVTATVLENLVLTARGSSKETRHLELAVDGLAYEPGDALGFLPRNSPASIESLLAALELSADAPVTFKGRATRLGACLETDLEIAVATPRFLTAWGTLSEAATLRDLAGDEDPRARAAFLRAHHVVDIVRRYPVRRLAPQQLVDALRPLQPRLYSIASSGAFAPGEAHLTVATVRYELHGEPRFGAASGFLGRHAQPDATLPVYVQANPHFRLPADDRPILMIGAGTGIAPFRAFVQERQARGAGGKSWLFFGERNFRTDFLYQAEWQACLKDASLTRLSVAFSRDASAKAYVQHRLLEHAREVFAWLEEGANVYVCGDAARLAPDVHEALVSVVEGQGGCSLEAAREYVAGLQRERRYQRDVY